MRVVSCVKMSLPVHLMWRGGGMDGELYVMNYWIMSAAIQIDQRRIRTGC